MSELVNTLPIGKTLRRSWQIPVLALGVLFFFSALSHLVYEQRPVSHAQRLQRVDFLREAGASQRAVTYLSELLARPDFSDAQRADLARRLASTMYEAECRLPYHSTDNLCGVATHYQTARRWGAELDAQEWMQWGDVLRWDNQYAEADDAYRQALRKGPHDPDRIRRGLIEIAIANSDVLSPQAVADLEALISSETAAARDYYFALEWLVYNLLESNQTDDALARVESATTRLAGTEEMPAVDYLRARCLKQAGRVEQAEALLRGLLDVWSVRDELWAGAALLLGHIQQEEDRPQAALTYFDEVLQAFPTGPMRLLSSLGRAECLATLGGHEAALTLFDQICVAVTSERLPAGMDRRAMRATVVSLGESQLQEGCIETAIRYLELALRWTVPADIRERIHLTTRLADGYALLANQHENRRDKDADDNARTCLAKAAELHLRLSSLLEDDDLGAAHALERAAVEWDAAGQVDRLIEELDRYASTHPNGVWRSTALWKLGTAYQSQGRYREAAAAFHDVITTYPRMPDALHAMVPMAQCLLSAAREGKEDAAELRRQGLNLLIGIVDDAGKDQLFSPSAADYREALYRLAEHYTRTEETDAPETLNQAIHRWESWLALYPGDSRQSQARFQLAQAYRRSAAMLRHGAADRTEETQRISFVREADHRTARALDHYEHVIADGAGKDAAELHEVASACLRMSYLYRGDCLFELGRYREAITACREAAWRYENLPSAITASMQVIHAHQRLGEMQEAAAALARTRWLLTRIPSSAFDSVTGGASKVQWETWIAHFEKSGLNG